MKQTYLLAISLILSLSFRALPAHADAARTPTLTSFGRRMEAIEELRGLVTSLPRDARERVTGMYVAFEPNASDVSALAACDDDGDYVIVLSDALLALLEHVTHAAALDEMGAQYKLLQLAGHVASHQRPGERLVPPPAGAFEERDSRELQLLHTTRFRQALAGILAREVALAVNGDLTCAHPTATRERGDDEWTADEAANAARVAEVLYASRTRATARDNDALMLPFAEGVDAAGYVAWLTFFARLTEQRASTGWTYPRLHGDAEARRAAAAAIMDARVGRPAP